MSFITKRERVFNEYDLLDLPARNEGKLKAYASCTDARAWSHFCSDKSDHLVEIIKRNNDTCRPKYVPTDVIVDTLMVAKNAEINRLRRKIEEFEQLLTAYDELDLTCEQKCDIATAHAAIKAANKELDELCLDLDLSTYTEGIDSEAFETGKSRGDEPSRHKVDDTAKSKGEEWTFERDLVPKMETKCNQTALSRPCDASTIATDPRIEELQEDVIVKDAKLNAMQNTIAVMENDVYEPYTIYANIYTALEIIFGILCQNDKYKQYLDLLTAGKDTRSIDIRGKILFKLKVFERFSLALIAPCSQDCDEYSTNNCSCYHCEIVGRVETTFALTSSESHKPCLDNKRAQLVADITHNEEMKEILSKDSTPDTDEIQIQDDLISVDICSIDGENIKRLKCMQENFNDLMTCYESLKHEKDCLKVKCHKYGDLETELENLRCQLREYNTLWSEKEYYKNRSLKLDELKEQYLLLTNETINLETQLKAESQINNIKYKTIDELRNENILLEKKLDEASIAFEKDRNALLCKLNETECKVMCEEQQIKSLSIQIDRLLEQNQERETNTTEINIVTLLDEIESQKEQIRNLKEALFCNEEEKQNLQEQFHDNIKFINELKMEIEDWKSTYNRAVQRNGQQDKYIDDITKELETLARVNQKLTQEVKEKSSAVENLIDVLNNKSKEINILMSEIEGKNVDNENIFRKYQEIQEEHKISFEALEKEKTEVLASLQIARQESQELLQMAKSYDDMVHKQDNTEISQHENQNKLKELLLKTITENKKFKNNLIHQENKYSILLQEVQELRELNNHAIRNVNNMRNERDQYKMTYELAKKESDELASKHSKFEGLKQELDYLRESREKLMENKHILENEIHDKNIQLDLAINSFDLSKKESTDLLKKIQQYENSNEDLNKVKTVNDNLLKENLIMSQDLSSEKKKVELLGNEIKQLKEQNECLLEITQNKSVLEKDLMDSKISFDELSTKNINLHKEFDKNTIEINSLKDNLKDKIEENMELTEQIQSLKHQIEASTENIKLLEKENFTTQNALSGIKKETAYLNDKAKEYEKLQIEFHNLLKDHLDIKTEKELIENELTKQTAHINKIEKENRELHSHSQTLLLHSKDLESALMNARAEVSNYPYSKTQSQYAVILSEIEEMKKEKLESQSKIRNLLNKLDETETIISDLSEQLLTRDDKIAVLENHINELEDEVRQLHNCLDEVVVTGEQLRDNNYQNIEQSLKKMEAHHSKAAHNMKMELAQLLNNNTKLENQLSSNKLITDKTLQDKHKYVSQIINLQNEREIIVTDIKQLELTYVGDSTLSPGKCDIEDILTSLERIQKYLDAKSSRSNFLEQTLSQVQTSSQVLLSKAEEAKKIVEKEKQKIINEKEDAIRERLNIEKQLIDLKETLHKQISCDQDIIRELEVEILNKDLIIDKINKTTQDYISKLEKDIKNMKKLYEHSLMKLEQVQEKSQIMSEQNSKNIDIINKLNLELQTKSKEVDILQDRIKKLKNISKHSLGIQTQEAGPFENIKTQTENRLQHDKLERLDLQEKNNIENMEQLIAEEINHEAHNTKLNFANEVQVLNATIEPTFICVKNIYLSYKMKQLDRCKIEQHSFTCFVNDANENNSKVPSGPSSKLNNNSQESQQSEKYPISHVAEHHNLINIYNKSSMCTDSTRITNNDKRSTLFGSNPSQGTPTKRSSLTRLGLTNESFDTKRYDVISNRDKPSNLFSYSNSGNSTDKDIFVIYQDSQSNDTPETHDYADPWTSKRQSKILVETYTVYPNTNSQNYIKKSLSQTKEDINYKDSFLYLEDKEHGNNKNKLNIRLPRAEIGSPSIATSTDKKSISSNRLYILPKRISTSTIYVNDNANKITHTTSLPSILSSDDKYLNSTNLFNTTIDKNVFKHTSAKKWKPANGDNGYDEKVNTPYSKKIAESVVPKKAKKASHSMIRTDANKRITKNSNSSKAVKETKKDNTRGSHENFGIKYILDTINCEMPPENSNTFNKENLIRETHSDESIVQRLHRRRNEPGSAVFSNNNFSHLDHKSETNFGSSNSKIRTGQIRFQEQSVLVKMDTDYENRIENLTKLLENTEKDYKKKIEAIKMQYDNNVKCIINDHNEGVKTIQSIHEETFQDIIKVHENEVENLRSMSIEAMRKVDKLERENRTLKTKYLDRNSNCSCEDTIKSPRSIKRYKKCREPRNLTKTTIEAFNVKPKIRSHGPCTCSLEVNISETIRNIFEQVDAEQRILAEHTYMKYIANKIVNDNVEALDTKELSFLHLKVCRIWKTKMSQEESLQKRIDLLENELIHKQRHAQKHMADLDRGVSEERRRLQELREAAFRKTPRSRPAIPGPNSHCITPPPPTPPAYTNDSCGNPSKINNTSISERRSAGDLVTEFSKAGIRSRRLRVDINRAVMAKPDAEERRQKKLYSDEPPTRLRRSYDRQALRPHKKL